MQKYTCDFYLNTDENIPPFKYQKVVNPIKFKENFFTSHVDLFFPNCTLMNTPIIKIVKKCLFSGYHPSSSRGRLKTKNIFIRHNCEEQTKKIIGGSNKRVISTSSFISKYFKELMIKKQYDSNNNNNKMLKDFLGYSFILIQPKNFEQKCISCGKTNINQSLFTLNLKQTDALCISQCYSCFCLKSINFKSQSKSSSIINNFNSIYRLPFIRICFICNSDIANHSSWYIIFKKGMTKFDDVFLIDIQVSGRGNLKDYKRLLVVCCSCSQKLQIQKKNSTYHPLSFLKNVRLQTKD